MLHKTPITFSLNFWTSFSPTSVICETAIVDVICIHSESEKIGGVYSSGQKDWRKKYENGKDKKSRQEYVNHEIYDKMAYLIKNMILVCVYLRFEQLLNRIGRNKAVLFLNTVQT